MVTATLRPDETEWGFERGLLRPYLDYETPPRSTSWFALFTDSYHDVPYGRQDERIVLQT